MFGVFGKAGVYPSDFETVEEYLAMAVHEVPLDPELYVLFVPVDHRHGHPGTTPRPFCADGQQKL